MQATQLLVKYVAKVTVAIPYKQCKRYCIVYLAKE